MMRLTILAPLTLLAACGGAHDGEVKHTAENLRTFDVAEAQRAPPAMVAPPGAAAGETTPPIKVAIPQMAYSYGYVFRLPEAAVAAAQQRHVALCDRLGPARCQVLSMASAGGEDTPAAALKLRVASDLARSFGAQLTQSIAQAGGRAVSATIAAEDVSKAIVDTEARLRQRELLVARLTEILRTRQGKVAELVEAERSVAAAQEEIDQARGWLAELRGRVAMATFDIQYQPVAPGPAAARGGIADSVVRSASAFVGGLGVIAQLLIFLAPWAVLLGGLAWIVRRVRRVRPGWLARRTPPPAAAAAPD